KSSGRYATKDNIHKRKIWVMTNFQNCPTYKLSFGVERRRQLQSRHCEAASFAGSDLSISVGEYRRQRARVKRRQPQSQQVALALGLRAVIESRAVVQDGMVVNQLYVAWTKLHMYIQRGIVSQRVEHIQGLDLTGGKRRNFRKAPRRFYVLPLIDS